MKTVLFGGTFDPIHEAHLQMTRLVLDAFKLDNVLLMPTAIPPHKLKADMASAKHRIAMCKLAVADDARFAVSDMEIARGGASFTVDTLTALHAAYPDTQWYLLVGADMFLSFGTWYRFEDILRLATVCVVPRADITAAQLRDYAMTLPDFAKVEILDTPVEDISSTTIRAHVLAGESTDGLVPPAVAEYIAKHHLYTIQKDMDLAAIEPQCIEIIRKRESEYRFAHSLEVAKSAEKLAKQYGGDVQKARFAGLMHDVMKDVSQNEQLQIFEDFDILLTDVEQHAPKLWHAMAGAAFLEYVLRMDDRDILNAVRYHTTARAGMSLLEKIVYVADFISADREYPDVDVMRKLAKQSLEDAMRYALEYTVRDLRQKGATVHPDTIAALAAL